MQCGMFAQLRRTLQLCGLSSCGSGCVQESWMLACIVLPACMYGLDGSALHCKPLAVAKCQAGY